MKKGIFILILSLLVLPLFFNGLSAQNEDLGLGALNPEQVEDTSVKLTTSAEYLSQEWKTILLENAFVKGIDSFLQKINVVFFVLFAENYSMSLKLLLVIIFWNFFLFSFYYVFKYYSTFSKLVSFGISLAFTVILSHINVIEMPANALIWLFLGDKAWWIKVIIGIIVLAILVTILGLIKKFGKNYKEKRQKVKDEINRIKLEGQVKAGENITDALSKIK